jgi:hypothetical protein
VQQQRAALKERHDTTCLAVKSQNSGLKESSDSLGGGSCTMHCSSSIGRSARGPDLMHSTISVRISEIRKSSKQRQQQIHIRQNTKQHMQTCSARASWRTIVKKNESVVHVLILQRTGSVWSCTLSTPRRFDDKTGSNSLAIGRVWKPSDCQLHNGQPQAPNLRE